ncbi:hypothetical protein E9993_11620 [Labilibacter sediminis]|nr:hypothetical protein E9993_11620 [Labilibacter sediminis]
MMSANNTFHILLYFLIFIACNNDNKKVPVPENGNPDFISAVDISRYPEISSTNPVFYDLEGNQKDFLSILKEN